jgi:PTS system nitrogen regulatory IIA component
VALILLDAPWPGAETPDGMPVTRLLFFISQRRGLHVNMLGLLARSIAAGKLGRAIDEGADDAALLQALVEGSAEPFPSRSGGNAMIPALLGAAPWPWSLPRPWVRRGPASGWG